MWLLFLQEVVPDYFQPPDGKVTDLEVPSPVRSSSSRSKKTLKTTNAYFYWVTREQGSFDWFKSVMNEIADLDQRVGKNHSHCIHVVVILINVYLHNG